MWRSMMIGTLALDGWAVTFGTTKRGWVGGLEKLTTVTACASSEQLTFMCNVRTIPGFIPLTRTSKLWGTPNTDTEYDTDTFHQH